MNPIKIILIVALFLNILIMTCFAEEEKVVTVNEINEITLQNGRISLYGVSIFPYDFLAKMIMKDRYSAEIGLKKLFGEGYKVSGDYDFAIKYKDAIRLMSDLLNNKSANISAVENTNKYIITKNDININLLLIEQGYASVDRPALSGSNLDDKLILAENNARTSQKGIWGMKINHSDHNKFIINNGKEVLFSWKDFFCTLGIAFFALGYMYWLNRRENLNIIWLVFNLVMLIVWWYGTPNPLHWLNLVFRVILFGIILVAVINSMLKLTINNMMTLFKAMVCIISIMFYVAMSFASLYYYTSNTQLDYLTEYTYDISGGIQVKRNISKPLDNYIDIPTDCLETSNEETYYYLNPRDAFYFSAVTLFTVGYGEMTAKGSLKNWAIVEMFIGEILRLSVFAYLVSKVKFEGLSLEKVDGLINSVKPMFDNFLVWIREQSRKVHEKSKLLKNKYFLEIYYRIRDFKGRR